MKERESLIALNMLPKIGPIRVRRLTGTFGSASAVLSAPPSRLRSVDGIGRDTADIISRWEDHADLSAELANTAERGIEILTADSPVWPAPFHQIPDAPLVLYVWGHLEERDRHAIAVVGSRRTTHYGRNCAHKLSFQLGGAGFTIISGLARGIDTAAHEGALASGGRTIAVLGSGLGQLYPPENMSLAERIADGNGAVVSEFPLLTAPDQQTFPQRNRIVAGWCTALLVVECPSRSGALITANLANDYGRQVFAIPGQIDHPSSAGCNELIRTGATLVTDGSQIIDDLSQLPVQTTSHPTPPAAESPLPKLSEEELLVFESLGPDQRAMDQIIATTGLPVASVSSLMLRLEMKNLVKQLPGHYYIKAS